MACLPGYNSELNPVEYISAHWKQLPLPNVCPKDYWNPDETARRTLKLDRGTLLAIYRQALRFILEDQLQPRFYAE